MKKTKKKKQVKDSKYADVFYFDVCFTFSVFKHSVQKKPTHYRNLNSSYSKLNLLNFLSF
jgi:hypothetical protein